MAEYIDRNLLGEVVDSHGNVHYENIMNTPTADVIERSKIDKAINKLKQYSESFVYAGRRELVAAVENCIDILERNIGK